MSWKEEKNHSRANFSTRCVIVSFFLAPISSTEKCRKKTVMVRHQFIHSFCESLSDTSYVPGTVPMQGMRYSADQKQMWGLPWWRSGWESACRCRGHGFEPWSGKIPHAAERLGPWATITEPARPEPVLRNKRGHDSERPAHRDGEWPPLATTRESPRTETKTQHSHK